MEGKIGLFVSTDSGYHKSLADDVRRAAEREGLEIEVVCSETNAIKQAQDLVRFAFANPGRKLCAFIVPVADTGSSPDLEKDSVYQLARRALQKDMGFVLLNHGREEVVQALRKQHPGLPIGMVVVDNPEFGRLQARQLRALVAKGGRVLLVRGNPFDTASTDRTAGFHELVGGDYKVEQLDARWMDDIAETSVHRWVTSPLHRESRLDGIVAQNDHMGLGARRALDRAGRELGRTELRTLPVIGGDGLPGLGLSWFEQGVLTSTISVTLPGGPAVRALASYWRGGVAFPAVLRLPVSPHPEVGRLKPTTAVA